MRVSVKRFNAKMEVRQTGIEFEVRSSNGKDHLGDLVLTKTELIWCPGKTRPQNGRKIKWEDFIKLAQEFNT